MAEIRYKIPILSVRALTAYAKEQSDEVYSYNLTKNETERTGKEMCSPKILSLIKVLGDQTLTLKEIMNGLEMKNRDNFMKNHLSPAIANGYLAMLYPDVPKHRKQAYYLTEKGRSVLLIYKTNICK